MKDKYDSLPLNIERQYFVPIPKGQKNPAHKNWQQRHFSEKQLLGEMNAGKNLGLITESYPCFDVDVDDEKLARKIIRFIKKRQPNCGIRTREDSPRVILFYGLADDTDLKKQVIKVSPNDKVEFLAKGQQFVLHGKHPDGALYEYSINKKQIDDLTEDQIAELFNAIHAEFSIEEATEEKVDLKESNSTSESKSIEDHIKTITKWKGGDERYESIKQLSFQYYKKSIPDSANILMLKSLMETVPKRNRDDSWDKYMSSTRIDRLVTDLSSKRVSKDDESEEEEIKSNRKEGSSVVSSIKGQKIKQLYVKGGNMEKLVEWINDCGYIDNKMVSTLAAHSIISYLASAKFYLNELGHDDRTNLYLLGVGDTGTGKDKLVTAAKTVIGEIFNREYLGEYLSRVIDDAASAQGIEDALYNNGAVLQDVLLTLDEFGSILPRNDKDTTREALNKFILSSYTKSNGYSGMRVKAKNPKVVQGKKLDHAHLTIIGGTTQTNLLENVSGKSGALGMTARFLMFDLSPYKVGGKRIETKRKTFPNDLREVLLNIAFTGCGDPEYVKDGDEDDEKKKKKGNIPKRSSSRMSVAIPVGMSKKLIRINHAFDEEMGKVQNSVNARARVGQNSKKLCLNQGIIEDPEDPIVTREMLDIAMSFVINSVDYEEELFLSRVSESPFHAAMLACEAVVVENENNNLDTNGTTLRNVIEMNRLSPSGKNDVLKELVESGRLFMYKATTKGRGRKPELYYSEPQKGRSEG